MSLNFLITANDRDLQDKLRRVQASLRATAQTAQREGASIEGFFAKIAQGAAMLGVGASLKEFVGQVATVRGEFQKLEVAFTTMLGSKEKADALMAQLTQTAATTPFQMSEVAGGAKQLLAYGMAAEEVNETLTRLGDIAAGLSIPLSDLTYLYGTTMVQGRLYTQDFNQFLNRGIPLVKALSEQMHVAEGDVKKLVEQGKIGFPQIEKAIKSLTAEGSQFGGLMAAQSQTIAGQISNLQDQVEQMFNELGRSSEGIISEALSVTAELVSHWREIGQAVVALVTAYGTYKAALIALTAAQKAYQAVLQAAVVQQRLAAMSGVALSTSQAAAAASTALLTRAFQALRLAIASNPIGLIATLVATAAASLVLFRNELGSSTTAVEKLKAAQEDYDRAVGKEVAQIDLLFRRLQEAKKGTKQYDEAKQAIISQYGQYLAGLGKEVEQLDNVAKAYEAVKNAAIKAAKARAIEKATASAADELVKAQADARKQVAEILRKKYGQQMMKNAKGEWESLVDIQLRAYDRGVEKGGKGMKAWLKQFDKISTEFGPGRTAITTLNAIKLQVHQATQAQSKYNEELRLTEQAFGRLDLAFQKEEKNTHTDYTPLGEEKKKNGGKDKAETERQRLAKEAEERKAQLAAYYSQLEQQEREMELQLQAALIETMQEGIEKQRAQIALRYEQLTHENRLRATKMVEELRQARLTQWQDLNPKANEAQVAAKKNELQATLTIDHLHHTQLEQLKAYDRLARELREKGERDLLDNLLTQFRNYQQQRITISQEADRNVAQLQKEVLAGRIDTSQFIAATEQIKRQAAQATKQINEEEAREAAESSSLIVQLFEDASRKTRQEVEAIRQQAEQLLAWLKGQPEAQLPLGITPEQAKAIKLSPEQMKALAEALQRLREQAEANVHPFERLTKSITTMLQAKDKQARSKALQQLKVDVHDTLHITTQLIEQLASVFEQGGDNRTAHHLRATAQALQEMGSIAQSAVEGKYVEVAVKSVTTIIGLFAQASKAEAEHQQALTQLHAQRMAQEQAYRNALFDTSLALDRMGALGEDAYGRTTHAAQLAAQKQQQLALSLQSLEGVRIKSGSHKEGFLWWRKQVDDYRGLLDRYPQLINSAGQLDLALAKSLLNNATFKDDAAKATLQRVIDYAEQAEKATKAIDQYLQGLFGEMGNTLSTALIDAFRNGTDASQAFGQSVEQMLDRLASDMAQSLFIAPLLEQAKEQITATMTNDALSHRERMAIASQTFRQVADAAKAQQEEMFDFLREMDEAAQQSHFRLLRPTQGAAAERGGFATASQQSIDELNGRFAALQMSGAQTAAHALDHLTTARAQSEQLSALGQQLGQTGQLLQEIQQLDALRNAYLQDLLATQSRHASATASRLDQLAQTLREKL